MNRIKSPKDEEKILKKSPDIKNKLCDSNQLKHNIKKQKQDKLAEKVVFDNIDASAKNKKVSDIEKEKNLNKKSARSPSQEAQKEVKTKKKKRPFARKKYC